MTDKTAIKALNLTKRFGKRISVDNLHLSINYGELYALLGDNGAGKTTTLNMFTTSLKPDGGEFYICGYHGTKQSEQMKGSFGVVSQDVCIYNELTAYENLNFVASLYKLPKDKSKQRIIELLAKSDLSDRANDLVQTFSGGMQRKLSIASALLHQPSVLFMDEPTVGLNPSARRQIWSTLNDLKKQGVTILLTTHYLEEAEILADRIGIIRQGKLVAEGTVDELRKQIHSIYAIEVRLAKHISQAEAQNITEAAIHQLNMQVQYDAIHCTLIFTPRKEVVSGNDLGIYMQSVVNWLVEKKIAFVNFQTNEPNLEDIFLNLTAAQRQNRESN